MGRKKKVVEEIEEKVEEVKEKKVVKIQIVAEFRGRDEEGDKVKMKYESEGKDVEEALANMDFPKGLNCLVNVTATRGSNKIEKALAPHKARAILEHKNVADFNVAFRGL